MCASTAFIWSSKNCRFVCISMKIKSIKLVEKNRVNSRSVQCLFKTKLIIGLVLTIQLMGAQHFDATSLQMNRIRVPYTQTHRHIAHRTPNRTKTFPIMLGIYFVKRKQRLGSHTLSHALHLNVCLFKIC